MSTQVNPLDQFSKILGNLVESGSSLLWDKQNERLVAIGDSQLSDGFKEDTIRISKTEIENSDFPEAIKTAFMEASNWIDDKEYLKICEIYSDNIYNAIAFTVKTVNFLSTDTINQPKGLENDGREWF